MRLICTLVNVTRADNQPGVLAISPGDNVYFLMRPDLQGDVALLAEQIEKQGGVQVLGAVFEQEETAQ